MFTIFSDDDQGSTLVSNLFIDEYMRDANDAQIKTYLYLLRMMSARRRTSISDIADHFNHTEREVLRSLRYWEDKGLLELEYDADKDLVGIHVNRQPRTQDPALSRQPLSRVIPMENSMTAAEPAAVTASKEAPSLPEPVREHALTAQPDTEPGGPETKKTAPAPAKAWRSALEAFRSNKNRAQLLFVIEQYIGKPLSPAEIQTVYYISEELHFSDALIDYLLQYCIDRGKKDFRYIEKVAVNWASEGITTPRQAERAVSPLRSSGRIAAGTKPSANKFNQFVQNQYNFDELEQEILGG